MMMRAIFVGSTSLILLVAVAEAADVLPGTDFCEFPTAKDARAFGWDTEATNGKPALEAVGDAKVGSYAVKARGKNFMGDWGTLVLTKDVNLSPAKKGDKIVFFVKQNLADSLYLNIDGSRAYRSFPVPRNQWSQVVLDLDPAEWTWSNEPPNWGRAKRFAFYAHEFTSAEHYLIVDGLSFEIGGAPLAAEIPPSTAPAPDASATAPAAEQNPPVVAAEPPPISESWVISAAAQPLPQEDKDAWLLGNADAFWAVSKRNGGILGGWNGPRRERCVNSMEGTYFLEDKQGLVQASENGDVVVDRRLSPEGRQLQVVCTNAALKDIQISKTYAVQSGTLTRKIEFTSKRTVPMFLSYRSEARLDPAFRQEGSYVGAGSLGPIEAAADITSERQPLFYTNSRGMILSNPARGYSLAHYRLKQDGVLVLPWWTYSRAESAKDCFYYTPTGWKMPFGISNLPAGGAASYEENLTVSPGNYHDFVTRDYGAREDVRKQLDDVGPVPAWLKDVKVYAFESGMDGRDYTAVQRLRRLVELTDEGDILVLSGISGQNWADYYVEQGQVGFHGGWITGPEYRDWMQKIKAVSPRIRLGIYCYMDAASDYARLCKEHPDWFRAVDKEGNSVNHFAGIPSRTTMFNRPECRQAILDQYDRMFKYLGVDFIYCDDGMTNNLVNWQTGDVLRDADCYDFFRGLREVARRNGPDKAVFLNGQGNPFGDVNFIEAYTRIGADFWRPFAGVALGIETFLVSRPDVPVIPLYWTEPLSREYVNRVLALGWIPGLECADDVASRPFVTASYEIGNANPINAVYEPDWRRDKDLKIESYAIRRLGDRAAILSFISYEDAPKRQTIRIDVDSLGLDPDKPLYAWLHTIRDALQYKGLASEKAAKAAYAETGWILDQIAVRQCRYAGDYRKELSLDVDLAPGILTMLVVGNEPGAVYSLDGLPQNFFLAKTRGVQVEGRQDADRKEISLRVDSERDRCEVLGFVPPNWSVKAVSVDGVAVMPEWIFLGDAAAPLVSVSRGRHDIRIACAAPTTTEPLKLDGIQVAVKGGAIEIACPAAIEAASKALVTVTQGAQTLLNRTAANQQGVFRVPLGPGRGGNVRVAIRAVEFPDRRAAVECPGIEVALPQNVPELGLTPKSPGVIPEENTMRAVNKTINGLDVLSAATQTTATTIPPFQPDLKGLTVDVLPETLTIDAGTTRKIEGYLGAAFGGLEIKDLRTVRLRLKNTYFGALHISGPNIHTHAYYPQPRLFAGFMVDYHTAAGYTKRAALSVGVVHPDCNTPYPSYGKGGKPDQVVDLGPIVQESAEKEFDLDLSRFAPEGWDGQVWFSAGSDWALPGRRLNVQILAANQPLTGTALGGTDPAAVKREFLAATREQVIPKATVAPVIDGRLDDPAWEHASQIDQFFIVGGLSRPTTKTAARLLYDDRCLYVALECEETKRNKPIAGKGDIWRDDEVEIYLDPDGSRKDYRHLMINAAGSMLELDRSGSRINIGAKVRTSIEGGNRWTVEVAIPFQGLCKTPRPGDVWGANLCRYRPEGSGFPLELITWAPAEHGFGGDDVAKFGTISFR